jgi:hypothetical protein
VLAACWTARLFVRPRRSGLRHLRKRASDERAGEETRRDGGCTIGGRSEGAVFQLQAVIARRHGYTAQLEILSAYLLELEGDEQRAEEAQRKLENAGMELGLALVSIALRGGGGAPSSAALFDSVDGLAEDPDVRRALERLDVAEVLATDVHDRVEAARAHLGAAALLRVLKVEGGGDEVAQREHSPCCAEGYNGVMELHLTESKAVELVGAIVAAMKEAFGVSAAAPTDVSCL